jgi:restriction endonuclease S subunit
MKRKLGDLLMLQQGVNQTRIKKDKDFYGYVLYDQSSFEEDLMTDTVPNKQYDTDKKELILSKGDIVINAMQQEAAIVGRVNAGKILPTNFVKVIFLNKNLDKRYFVYLFNANKTFQRQKEREVQGTAAVMRIPMKSIKKLEIPFIGIEDQKKIGLAYTRMMSLKKKQQILIKETETLTLQILEQKTRDNKG